MCQAQYRLKWQGTVQVKKAAVSHEAGGLRGHSFKRFPLVMTTLENQSLKKPRSTLNNYYVYIWNEHHLHSAVWHIKIINLEELGEHTEAFSFVF